ncbi:CPBP family intramembrane metalloprotease [Candidatus Woesearchaeota archaeon]|jgi:membrane protease YdiL (CAAX protease family)|nr:CPBP family intramembrane metalloprotease [Candidatus Woesearchaeota archaeon]MBT7237515.1 CPBP family intramembrane metalloprotease [Candidatus Woesearchaeota archaeon]
MKWLALLIPYISAIFGLYAFNNIWLAVGIYHILILIFLASSNKLDLDKNLYKGWDLKIGWLAIAIGFLAGIIIFLTIPLITTTEHLNNALVNLGLGNMKSLLVFILYWSFVNPIIEVVFWRGYLQDKNKKIAPIDFAFSGYHLLYLVFLIPWQFLIFPFVFLVFASWIWRWMAYKYKGLLLPAISHIAADFTVVLSVYLFLTI